MEERLVSGSLSKRSNTYLVTAEEERACSLRESVWKVFLWVKKLFGVATHQTEQRLHLMKAIQHLGQDVKNICQSLSQIKRNLKTHSKDRVYQAAVEIIDFLLADIEKVQSSIEEAPPTNALEKIVGNYQRWIEEAMVWVCACHKKVSREEVVEAVARHVINGKERHINRDLQLIKEYQTHQIANLEMSLEVKRLFERRIRQKTAKILKQLARLKSEPQAKGKLEFIVSWRERIDHQRQELFEQALHQIDTLAKHAKKQSKKIARIEQRGASSEIWELEEKIEIAFEALKYPIKDRDGLSRMGLQVKELKKKGKALHANIHLLQGEVEHLEKLLAKLKTLEAQLKRFTPLAD